MRGNKKLWAWIYEGDVVKTIETKDQYDHMKGLGVDGVITSFPSKLKQELN